MRFVCLDAIHFKIREDGKVKTKAVYTVQGVNLVGHKEVLGLCLGESESATFWLQVLTGMQQRGLDDILIASIDNLRRFTLNSLTQYFEDRILDDTV